MGFPNFTFVVRLKPGFQDNNVESVNNSILLIEIIKFLMDMKWRDARQDENRLVRLPDQFSLEIMTFLTDMEECNAWRSQNTFLDHFKLEIIQFLTDMEERNARQSQNTLLRLLDHFSAEIIKFITDIK